MDPTHPKRQDLVDELALFLGAPVDEVHSRLLAPSIMSDITDSTERGGTSLGEEGDTEPLQRLLQSVRAGGREEREVWRRTVLDHLRRTPWRQTMIDIGGGAGADALWFARQGYEVWYYETDEQTAAFVRWRFERFGVPIRVVRSWQEMPQDTMDVVIGLASSEWIEPRSQSLKGVGGSLKVGGAVYITAADTSVPPMLKEAGLTPGISLPGPIAMARRLPPIHIVLPVYGALDRATETIRSLKATTLHHPVSVSVLDDGSPEPETSAMLSEACRDDPRIRLSERRDNRGYVVTVNEGLAEAPPGADIVFLNSDILLTRDWLGKLSEAAHSRSDIATVTPLSNQASAYSIICPDTFRDECNEFLETLTGGPPRLPEVPTGVGFCLYVRRPALDQVGPFDMAFHPGYGEEVDFCLRARAQGFVNVLEDRTFVYHYGNQSFGAARDFGLGSRQSEQLLKSRYPNYVFYVQEFLDSRWMQRIQDRWLPRLRPYRLKDRPRVLIQTHTNPNGGAIGGIETQVRILVNELGSIYDFYVVWSDGQTLQVYEHASDGDFEYAIGLPGGLSFLGDRLTREASRTVEVVLRQLLVTLQIDLVHIEHSRVLGWAIVPAVRELGLPLVSSWHDYYGLCPDYNLLSPAGQFCDLPHPRQHTCQSCLATKRSNTTGLSLEDWRTDARSALLASQVVMVPSEAAKRVLSRALPVQGAVVCPPWGPASMVSRSKTLPSGNRAVAVIGYSARQKGRALLVSLIPALSHQGIAIHFYGSSVEEWPELWNAAGVTFHGRYVGEDVIDLLAEGPASAALFASPWPETYSITLTEAWTAGMPAVVAPWGAPAVRVRATGAGVVVEEYSVRGYEAALTRLWQNYRQCQAAVRDHLMDQPSRRSVAAAHAYWYGVAERTLSTAREGDSSWAPNR